MNDSNTANWNRQRIACTAWKQAILFVIAKCIIKMFKNKQSIYGSLRLFENNTENRLHSL